MIKITENMLKEAFMAGGSMLDDDCQIDAREKMAEKWVTDRLTTYIIGSKCPVEGCDGVLTLDEGSHDTRDEPGDPSSMYCKECHETVPENQVLWELVNRQWAGMASRSPAVAVLLNEGHKDRRKDYESRT